MTMTVKANQSHFNANDINASDSNEITGIMKSTDISSVQTETTCVF